ncbi:MAG: 30S ribosomal protein S4 [Candidatus Eremiobacteraeota bacterium]|nr:30S ribosomal protein S4 [Candidatus Eremiobacteraeota bacterium]
MARYVGPVCRLCRREGTKLYLKGDRCYNDSKCAVIKRAVPPGQHGQMRRKLSNYGIQLREKQKLRRIYGLNERQFKNYFTRAERQKGVSGENFLRILERRLDNVIFRLGLSDSRSEARQFVRHGHVDINGHKVNIPSYQVKIGEIVAVREKSRSKPFVQESIEQSKSKKVPVWLELNYEKAEGRIISLPTRQEIDTQINEQLIVEFYSK